MNRNIVKEYVILELEREYLLPDDVDIDKMDYVAAGYVTYQRFAQFIAKIEEKFGIKFTKEEINSPDFRRLGSLVPLIVEKTSC